VGAAKSYIFENMKPCPFCGGQPEIRRSAKNHVSVDCRKCHLFILVGPPGEYGIDAAKKIWNTRYLTPKLKSVK
jgi:hypothetical protein